MRDSARTGPGPQAGHATGRYVTQDTVSDPRPAETTEAIVRLQDLEALFASMSEGVVVLDRLGTVLHSNAEASRILGGTVSEIASRTATGEGCEAVTEDESPFPADELPAAVALRTGTAIKGVVVGVRAGPAERVWVVVNAVPLRHHQEAPPYAVVVTFTDISDHIRQKKLLETVNRRLANVLDGSNDGFWAWHIEDGTVEYSDRWAAIVGCRLEDIDSSIAGWRAMMHPDDLPGVLQAVRATLEGVTDRFDCEHRLRHHDGRWIWVLSRARIVERSREGRPITAAGTCTDIQIRRQNDAMLRASLADNQRLVKELRQALETVKTLSGMLPICCSCKKIRNDRGYWDHIDEYLERRTDVLFTHGMCPDCTQTHYPGLAE